MKNKNKILTAVIAVITAVLAIAGINLLPDNDNGNSSVTENTSSISAETTAVTEISSVTTSEERETTVLLTTEAAETTASTETTTTENSYIEYHFRSEKLLNQHFEKHGGEFSERFSYTTAEEYEKGASDVINNPDSLYKTEAEDGDGVYYLESTNEFVILSTDGYIRTYFLPSGGIDYFNRQ